MRCVWISWPRPSKNKTTSAPLLSGGYAPKRWPRPSTTALGSVSTAMTWPRKWAPKEAPVLRTPPAPFGTTATRLHGGRIALVLGTLLAVGFAGWVWVFHKGTDARSAVTESGTN